MALSKFKDFWILRKGDAQTRVSFTAAITGRVYVVK